MKNKLFLESIRALPLEYITDETHVACTGDLVLCVSSELKPMLFEKNEWKMITFEIPKVKDYYKYSELDSMAKQRAVDEFQRSVVHSRRYYSMGEMIKEIEESRIYNQHGEPIGESIKR